MPQPRAVLAIGLLAMLALPGCGGCAAKATVTGVVTYDGQKVARGYVTFYPVGAAGDTQGARLETRGAEIVEGSYTIADLSPGKRKVVVSVPPKLTAGADKAVKAAPPAHPIPPTARGNGRVVDVGAGSQTLDLALTRP